MDSRFFKVLTAVAALAAHAACGGSSTTAPSTTTPPSITENFSSPADTPLPVGGSAFHTFTSKPGEIDVNLVSAVGSAPAVPVYLLLSTLTADGSACNTAVGVGTGGIGQPGQGFASSAAGSGTFCVLIFDYYNLGPITYAIQVLHN